MHWRFPPRSIAHTVQLFVDNDVSDADTIGTTPPTGEVDISPTSAVWAADAGASVGGLRAVF